MQVIGRRCLEAVMKVESANSLVFGVNQHGSASDDLCTFESPSQRVQQHVSSKIFPLLRAVDCQARKHNDGNVLRSLTLGNPQWSVKRGDCAGSQAVESNHRRVAPRCHVGSRFATLLVLQRVLAKEPV